MDYETLIEDEVVDDRPLHEPPSGAKFVPAFSLADPAACKRFETGAVRSKAAESTAYHLITPIGLKAVVAVYQSHGVKLALPRYRLGESVDYFYTYLSGDRSQPWLALGTQGLFEAIQQIRGGQNNWCANRAGGFASLPPLAVRAVAEAYAEGAVKYAPFNCELGFPIHDLLNHSIKHIFDYLGGSDDPTELGHAAWGGLFSIHSEAMWPDLNRPHLRTQGCKPPASPARPEKDKP